MSGVLKSLIKVFVPISNISKGVYKVVKKVLPIALAAAAVIFTGGAALGIAPFAGSIGGVVSSLGISGTLAGALTGAITSGGLGAGIGYLTGGWKGALKGGLLGAASGGVLGAVSPGMFGMGSAANAGQDAAINSIAGQNANALSGASTAARGLAPAGLPGITAPAAAVPAVAASPAVAVPGAGGNGLMGGFFSNPTNTMIAGNLLSGLFTRSDSSEAAALREKEGSRLFSDIYSTGEGDAGSSIYGDARQAVRVPRRFRFNPATNSVEEVATAR